MSNKTFTQGELNVIIEDTISAIKLLDKTKGGEYASQQDRLQNFRDNAASLDIDMQLVWRIFAGKHWDAITNFVKDTISKTERPRSEPIEGRVDDLIVYLILFKAILKDAASG